MGNFTFETENRTAKYETFEWDNTWINYPNDTEAKRVLYIGDSISCGTRDFATEQSGKKIFFDGFASSKGIDNPFLKQAVSVFAAQQGKRDAVIFNNGLHGWHLNDETDYKYYYEDFVKFLMEEYKGTPIYIVLTTHISQETLPRAIKRNEVALEVADKYNLPVIDLYTPSKEIAHMLKDDGVHFTIEGYKILADKILESIDL